MGRQRGVVAKGSAAAKAAAFVKPDRRILQGAGLQPQQWFAGRARLAFETDENGLADALSARRRARVHALYFGISVKQRDSAAADRDAVEKRDKKPDVRFEHLVERETVTLLR